MLRLDIDSLILGFTVIYLSCLLLRLQLCIVYLHIHDILDLISLANHHISQLHSDTLFQFPEYMKQFKEIKHKCT